ncbi:MAG: HAD family hydrolase [Firmicutes bacterium]|nr:HAD family hydrolase [Bacillota bacterium]
MKIETVIFDLDGTLIDSLGMHYNVLVTAFSRLGLPLVEREIVIRQMGSGSMDWDLLLPREIGDREDTIAQCYQIIQELWPEVYRAEADLFEGVPEVLKQLKTAGLTIGVATSGPLRDLIIELLARRNVYHYIGAMVCRNDVPKPKPSPQSIQKCLHLLGASPEKSVYVGDSIVDIQASRAAGVKSIAVLSGAGDFEMLAGEDPDYIIRDVTELDGVLFQLENER